MILVCNKNHTRKTSGATILKHIDPRVKVITIKPGLLIKKQFKNIVEAEKPDIIHAHLRKPTRILAKCKTDAAKFSTLHIGINGPQFLSMDGLIAISPWQLDSVPEEYAGQVKWIRNSLTPHPYPSPERVAELKQELKIGEDQFVVGGVGRLSSSKGWDTLITAFSKAKINNAKLIIIGEGRDKDKLTKLVMESGLDITLSPYKHNVKDYYSTFNVFVCPSREEPMGRVILEAMDQKVPVIASDIEGPKDILDEFPGFPFEVDNVDSLASALKQVHQKFEKKSSFEKADLSSHYVERVNNEMLCFYQETLGRKLITS